MEIRIVVKGIPVAQPRPRFSRTGNMVRTVSNPKKHPITAYKQHVAIEAALACNHVKRLPMFAGPVKCVITFIMPRPVAMVWKLKPMPRAWHCVKPDCDNLAKGVKDALKGIVWEDDSQVAVLEIGKAIASGDEGPKTIIIVSTL
jgi:Holliday junction resolvase RusA-like endonuclease